MAQISHDPDKLPYQEVTDDTFAGTAAPTFTIEEPRPGLRVLRGRCPRCEAIIDIPAMLSVFGGNRFLPDLLRPGSKKKGDAPVTEPVLCTCRDEHPGRPDGRTGCGAYWNFVIHPAST